MKKSYIPLTTTFISIIFHLIWAYLFIIYFDMGVKGAALAATCTYIFNLVLITTASCFLKDIKEAIFFPGKEAFTSLKEYVQLAGPSAALQCFEWWAFEAMTLMAAFLTVQETAAQIIIINNLFIMFSFSFGTSVAASTVIGNHIGAGDEKAAIRFSRFVQILGVVQSFVISTVFFNLRFFIADSFT